MTCSLIADLGGGDQLWVTYGLLTGLGFALAWAPSVVVVGALSSPTRPSSPLLPSTVAWAPSVLIVAASRGRPACLFVGVLPSSVRHDDRVERLRGKENAFYVFACAHTCARGFTCDEGVWLGGWEGECIRKGEG